MVAQPRLSESKRWVVLGAPPFKLREHCIQQGQSFGTAGTALDIVTRPEIRMAWKLFKACPMGNNKNFRFYSPAVAQAVGRPLRSRS